MNHVLLKDNSLEGKEYGSLRSLEAAILERTQASVFEIPDYTIIPKAVKYFGHGMNRGGYRKYFLKQLMKEIQYSLVKKNFHSHFVLTWQPYADKI